MSLSECVCVCVSLSLSAQSPLIRHFRCHFLDDATQVNHRSFDAFAFSTVIGDGDDAGDGDDEC